MAISPARLSAFRRAASVQIVWLVELTLGTTVTRWATRALTLGSDNYAPQIAPRGLRFGRNALNARGGLSAVGNATVTVAGVDLDTLAGDHVLTNAPCALFLLFVDGAETADEKIPLYHGAVESVERAAAGTWSLRLKDNSKRDLTAFPTETIGPDRYPFAQNFGHVLPAVFGHLGDTASSSAHPWHAPDRVAPAEIIDLFAGPVLHAGLDTQAVEAVWQWHPSAAVMSQVLDFTTAGDQITIGSARRRIVRRPIRATLDNDPTDWAVLQTFDPDTFVDVSTGDTVAVFMAGVASLGQMAEIVIEWDARGSCSYRILDDTTELATGSQSGAGSVALSLERFEGWAVNLILVELTGTAGFELLDLRLRIDFDQVAGTGQGQQESYWFSGTGRASQNPVEQLDDMLTDDQLLGLGTEAIVGDGWDEAQPLRSTWPFDLALAGQAAGNQAFLHKMAFDMGCALHPAEGGFTLAALDERRDPTLFISAGWHSPRRSDGGLTFARDINQANSQLINEVNLRFGLHAPSGQYRKEVTASSLSRFSGTCQLHTDGRLVDTGGDFEDRQVLKGEKVVIPGQIDYVVDSVTDATTLVVRPLRPEYSTIVAQVSGTTYHLGPNISAAMLESQALYRVRQPLGERQVAFTDEGGYTADTIQDDETGQRFVRWITRWFSRIRDRVRFPVMHVGVGLRPGDVLLVDHPLLRSEQQPEEATQLAAAVAAADTSITIDALGPIRRRYFLILYDASGEPEVMRVNTVTFGAAPDYAVSTLGVDRAQLGTQARVFAQDTPILLTRWKWLVVEAQPPTPENPVVNLALQAFPKPVEDVGVIVPDDFPDYSAATDAQKEYALFTANPNAQIEGDDFSRFGF